MPNPRGTPKNLKPPWKKGQSGNPRGSSALQRFQGTWRDRLKDLEPDILDILAQAVQDKRHKFQFRHRAALDLADRLWGKARETVKMEQEIEHALIVPDSVVQRWPDRFAKQSQKSSK